MRRGSVVERVVDVRDGRPEGEPAHRAHRLAAGAWRGAPLGPRVHLHQPGRARDARAHPGGGGLIAGVSAYIKYLRPEIKVIGVEPIDSNCLQAAMAAGRRVILPEVGLFADGSYNFV